MWNYKQECEDDRVAWRGDAVLRPLNLLVRFAGDFNRGMESHVNVFCGGDK